MDRAANDIAIIWETRTGYPMKKDVKDAILVILNQVSEFKLYLNPNNDAYTENILKFVMSLFYTYKTAVMDELYNKEKEIVMRCAQYIQRNQTELFGVHKTIPNPSLYHAIMTIYFCLYYHVDVDTFIHKKGLINKVCRDGLNLYDQFITRTLGEMNHRLGEVR